MIKIFPGSPNLAEDPRLPGRSAPLPLRLGARKSVQGNHPPDGSPSLFAHLFRGTLRVPFSLWGLLAPTPRRKLLKKLEQNFYVLLGFGSLWDKASSNSSAALTAS